jgi:hypothetical protein
MWRKALTDKRKSCLTKMLQFWNSLEWNKKDQAGKKYVTGEKEKNRREMRDRLVEWKYSNLSLDS